MYPAATPAQAPTRNPIARSLALAVLGVALAGAAVMRIVAFAVLLGLFLVRYLISLVHAWWWLARIRRRAAFVDQSPPVPPKANHIEGELEVVEATADVA